MSENLRKIVSFARRVGKGFDQNKQKIIDNNQHLLLKVSEIAFINAPVILDIGSGNGENTINLAKYYPEFQIIASEVYLSGVVQTINEINNQKVDNIKIFADDVNLLLSSIDDNFLDKIFILFADPWPKNKQHKRRMIRQDFLQNLALKLVKNGVIIIATDHIDYAKWIARHLASCKDLDYVMGEQDPEYYKPTKYHRKDLFGAQQVKWFYINKKH